MSSYWALGSFWMCLILFRCPRNLTEYCYKWTRLTRVLPNSLMLIRQYLTQAEHPSKGSSASVCIWILSKKPGQPKLILLTSFSAFRLWPPHTFPLASIKLGPNFQRVFQLLENDRSMWVTHWHVIPYIQYRKRSQSEQQGNIPQI